MHLTVDEKEKVRDIIELKGFVIVDYPKECEKCQFFHKVTPYQLETYQLHGTDFLPEMTYTCLANDYHPIHKSHISNHTKPEWCPVWRFPETESDYGLDEYEDGYIAGWNKCLQVTVENSDKFYDSSI